MYSNTYACIYVCVTVYITNLLVVGLANFHSMQDPNYPAILKDLVLKCWAQDIAVRPSAQEIVSALQSPDCLKLLNAHDTQIPYSAVSAALVVTLSDRHLLWLAHSIDNQYKMTVYELSETLSSTTFSKVIRHICIYSHYA